MTEDVLTWGKLCSKSSACFAVSTNRQRKKIFLAMIQWRLAWPRSFYLSSWLVIKYFATLYENDIFLYSTHSWRPWIDGTISKLKGSIHFVFAVVINIILQVNVFNIRFRHLLVMLAHWLLVMRGCCCCVCCGIQRRGQARSRSFRI